MSTPGSETDSYKGSIIDVSKQSNVDTMRFGRKTELRELREHTGKGDRADGSRNSGAGPKESSGDGREHFVCRLRVEWGVGD